MHEFFSYEIFGLMTMKTYLIMALICLVVEVVFGTGQKSSLKQVVTALVWPVSALMLLVVILCCVVVGFIAIMRQKK